MQIQVRRLLLAVGIVPVLFLAGCASSGDTASHEDVFPALKREEAALVSCSLMPGDPGVALTGTRLMLNSHAGGEPTSVDVATATCVLHTLRIPRGDARLFTSDSVQGGYDTVSWPHFAASWSFVDTVTFHVDIDPA